MYPLSEPYDSGLLDVGGGHRIHWQVCGNPDGEPAVVAHGGPGSGASPGWTRFFDPAAYRIVLFDQRGCGRSTPSAAETLAGNTTGHLVADMERLRTHLGIERWLLLGASWGTTLALAYAVTHPERVRAAVLFSLATTTRREGEWITEDMRRYFPEGWERLRAGAGQRAGERIVDAYARLLDDPDPAVRERAAREWCTWEDTHVAVPGAEHRPDPRYEDPAFRMVFARLVTHYWRHAAWLGDTELLEGVRGLAGVPGVLIHGALDLSSPLDVAWDLARAWPGGELILIGGAGHGAGHADLGQAVVEAVDRFR